jgi:hypothetical protein
MHAEISKRPFSEQDEKKHYQSVNLQMGRVQLDSDWNDAFEILLKSRSRHLIDIIGQHGSPNDGFRVDHDLILDHLDSSKGWGFSGAGSWKVDHLLKAEGFGSFMIRGNGALQRPVPPLLTNLAALRQILQDRGATIVPPGTPRLLLVYKVSATEPARIQLEITKADALDAPIATDPVQTYPCDDWQVIELDLATLDLTDYINLAIHVETTGTVHLDRLALAPGLTADLAPDDFYIQGGDGTQNQAGRYYVAGHVAIREGFETYRTQQDFPEPPAIDLADGAHHLAYLDVWPRTITAVEDPQILEVALGGPDTTSREKLVSQVKLLPTTDCGADIAGALRPAGSGNLSTGLSPDAAQGECDFKPELDYTGLENALYRIEIHQGGDANAATFKWSRNNGADLVAVTDFDADTKSVIVPADRFLCHGDWVELCDDVSDLADVADTAQHGKLAKIIEMTHQTGGVKILLENEAGDLSTAPFNGRTQRRPKLRKWHGVEKISAYLTFDGSGLPDTELEHGIHIAFSQEVFYHGDYWQFTARVNTREIEVLDHELPMGPVHHYAPLGLVALDGAATVFESCRKVFPPLTGITANHVRFDSDCCDGWSDLGIENVQQALEYLCRHQCCDRIVLPGQSIQDAIDSLGPDGGAIYLAPGIHLVHQTIRIKARKDITIKGEGAASRVIYLPQAPDVDEEALAQISAAISELEEQIEAAAAAGEDDTAAELRAERRRVLEQYYEALGYAPALIDVLKAIDEIRDQISAAGDDGDAVAELNARLAALELELAGVLSDLLHDLFRVAASSDITLTSFLMLGIGADSLVAITDESKVIEVSKCDLLSLPDQQRAQYPGRDKDYLEKIRSVKPGQFAELKEKPRLINPCIRISSGCRINIEANQMAGKVGLIQEGAYDDQQVPVIDELSCIGNRIRFSDVGLILITARRSRIEHNRISDVNLGLSEEDQETLDQLLEAAIDPDDPCGAHVDQQVDDILDVLRRLFFTCAPWFAKGDRLQGAAVMAFSLRKTAIRQNTLKGVVGLHLFHSQNNRIEANRVLAHENALVMMYNFKTRVVANDFAIVARKAIQRPEPRDDLVPGLKEVAADDATPAGPTGLSIDEAGAAAQPSGETAREPSMIGLKRAALVGQSADLEYPAAVAVHFSDRLGFKNNRVAGPAGWRSDGFDQKEFIKIINNYGHAWILARADAAVLLVRRFIDLMGLTPALRLFETVLKIFSGGLEVDWVAYWLEASGAGTFGGITKNLRESVGFLGASQKFPENPFIKILVNLFNWLLELQVVSRSRISDNRLDVGVVGIEMRKGLTLGGVRISGNRIAGAAGTAILWQALPALNNPEFGGVLLELLYQVLIYILNLMIGFLNRMLDLFESPDDGDGEEEQSVSAIYVLAAVFMLYGVGTICPNQETDGSDATDDDTTAPQNPFIPIIRELIAVIQDLIDQLDNADVKTAVKDLASSDDRMARNQIHGTGDGIHTNVANTLIASNRIEVWPGKAAITELFAMGRFFAAHAEVVGVIEDIYDPSGGQPADDHSAVAALGHALLNLNPDALQAAREMLAQNPAHWIGLAGMFEKIQAIADSSDFTAEIAAKIAALSQKAVVDTPAADIAAASEALLDKLAEHLTGYGMILAAPGVQVVDNKVEGKARLNIKEDFRGAPGGILMTGGKNFSDMLAYLLLLEESFPLMNIGAQGTRFDHNSLQWGTGHGLSFSSLPLMVDLKIENNEIQNHGLTGIYCDATTLSTLFSAAEFDFGKLVNTKRINAISSGSLLNILAVLLRLYKLKIVGNEINQCFNSEADEFYSESPPADVYRPTESIRLKATYATILGGLMVRNAWEVNCALNNVRFCGKDDQSWNAFGTVLIDCFNVKFEGNKILSNGRSGNNDQYYPRGGSMFLGGAGSLTVSNNDFSDNDGITLLVAPRFSLILRLEYYTGPSKIEFTAPWYAEDQALAQVLAIGNVFNIRDRLLSHWSKIHMGISEDLSDLTKYFIGDLTFSQNQVALPPNPETDAWRSVFLRGSQLAFNGNIISGPATADQAVLVSSRGIGLGNVLHKQPLTHGNINLSAANNQW